MNASVRSKDSIDQEESKGESSLMDTENDGD